MKLLKSGSPKLKLRTALFKGGFIHNPVLTQIIGICPIVAAANSFKNALVISGTLTAILLINESFSSLLLKGTPRWVRLPFYTLISALCLVVAEPLVSLFYAGNESGLGIYFYLLCANALTVIRCEKFACKTTVRNSLIDALACGLGYGIVAVIVGTIREFLNYGSLFTDQTAEGFSVVNSPFFALLILGFLASFHRYIVIRFYPNELSDTFFMNEVWEKVAIKDPGLSRRKEKRTFDEDSLDSINPRHTAWEEQEEDV